MNFIIRIFLLFAAVLITDLLMYSVNVEGILIALLLAAVLQLLNQFVKPVLILLTLPVTVVTLGIFLLVINALMVILTDKLIVGFTVNSFWAALWFSLILSVINRAIQSISGVKKSSTSQMNVKVKRRNKDDFDEWEEVD